MLLLHLRARHHLASIYLVIQIDRDPMLFKVRAARAVRACDEATMCDEATTCKPACCSSLKVLNIACNCWALGPRFSATMSGSHCKQRPTSSDPAGIASCCAILVFIPDLHSVPKTTRTVPFSGTYHKVVQTLCTFKASFDIDSWD